MKICDDALLRLYKNHMIAHKRYFEKHAEIGYREKKTSSYICNILSKYEYKVKFIGSTTGILAESREEKGLESILFRAEMDALDIGNGEIKHVCGHDAHMAIMLAMAEFVSKEYKGKKNIKFLFQPAEELSDGAKAMIKEELLKHNSINKIFGIHMWGDIETKKVVVNPSKLMAGGGQFKIVLKGKNSHGALPHMGVDPIVVSAEIITEIQSICSRQIDPIASEVISIGKYKVE